MNWLNDPCMKTDETFAQAALQRQNQLTKPQGSLGRLEHAVVQLAQLQRRALPQLDKVHICIFAADHGVAEAGVSAFPQAVTGQMVQNFLNGGAAISVLAKAVGACLEIVDVGIKTPLNHAALIQQRAGNGTANSAQTAAMNTPQLHLALQAGYAAAERAYANQADLFIGGEMGIANTTAATALYCALLDLPVPAVAGAGTGLDSAGIAHKIRVIEGILALHQAELHQPLSALRCVGGFEIAALVGAYIRAAQLGIPILLDGFISTAAALVAVKYQPQVREWLLLSHQSAEMGHRLAADYLGLQPLLDLGMRLGEGSGAAIAIPLLRLACVLHTNMATFAEAAVAAKL